MNKIEKLVNKIRKERLDYNLSIPEALGEEKIINFKLRYKDYFKIDAPEGYLYFLKLCDGLDENGFVIYSAIDIELNGVTYGIIENNKQWHEIDEENADYIYFGTSGHDLFIYNKVEQKFELRDRYCGEVLEEYTSIEDMLEYILKLMLG